MKLLIDDTVATSTYTVPIVEGWVSSPDGIATELVRNLAASAVDMADAALLPSARILPLQSSHDVVPTVAVVAGGVGAVAMRTPVRPDEIESTPVRLLDAGSGAELLARATLLPFYGITATGWIRDDSSPEAALAEVVIVEGAEALREPEAGFSEDLSRAWFILTAQPVVSHLLVTPRGLPHAQRQEILDFLDAARTEGLARRREWRAALADREGVSRDRAGAFWAAQRLSLEHTDRQALRELLTRGSRGTSDPSPTNVTFIDGPGSM